MSETADRGRAAQINEKHRRHLFDAVFNYYETPLPLQRGRGVHLYDFDGNEYLDFFAGIVTVNVGHCHPRVTKAIQEQAETLQHVSTLYPTGPIVELAAKLAEITPGDLSKTYFTNSGTEANETAVLLAQLATGNQAIVALRHSYSGRSAVARSLAGQSVWKMQTNQIAAIVHAPAPYCYRCPFKLSYPDCGVACAEDLEEVIATSTPGVIAGFLAEPVLGAGGYIVPPPEYFRIAAEIVRRHGGLFIADEVQTGFGRTGGKWFGIEHWDVRARRHDHGQGDRQRRPARCNHRRCRSRRPVLRRPQHLDVRRQPDVLCRLLRVDLGHRGRGAARKRRGRWSAHLRPSSRRARRSVRGHRRCAWHGPDAGHRAGARPQHQGACRRRGDALDGGTKARGLLIGKGGLYGNVLRIGPPLNITAEQVDEGIEVLSER